jgi:hypothetical protein
MLDLNKWRNRLRNGVFWLSNSVTTQKIFRMAKPNYSFEKRQRELAKKKKKEEKRQRKAGAEDAEAPEAEQPPASSESTPGEPS